MRIAQYAKIIEEFQRLSNLLNVTVSDLKYSDIVNIERIAGNGPALLVELHPRFDNAVADLTKDRAGQRLIISVCDRVIMEPLLNEPVSVASFVLTAYDADYLKEVEASLRSATCDGVPVG